MAVALPSQLSPAIVGVVQWTLVGIEILVLAWVVAWLGRECRVGHVVGRFIRRVGRVGRRTALTSVDRDDAMAVGGVRPTRLVSAAGGGSEPARLEPATGPSRRDALWPSRVTRTPARGVDVALRAGRASAALHCPGCGALLVHGDVAARLVTRCPGCERRVAARLDGDRVVVTLER